jgi:signal transduction histidine kinase
MPEEFWNNSIVFIYFFYGLAFYSLGFALLIESGRASELSLARSMRLLAGFGLLHGVHEWFDMLEQILDRFYNTDFPNLLIWARLSVLITSFIALLAFGEHLFSSKPTREKLTWRITISVVTWYSLSTVAAIYFYDLENGAWDNAIHILSRYIIGIPGALLACIALWQQRVVFREQGMDRFNRDLTVAAVGFALYGIVGQIFTNKSKLFPSTFLNTDLFESIFGFPIELFRAVMAGVVTVSMIRVLRALEVENRQRLKTVETEKINAEYRSHEELTRLNAELKHANEETTKLLAEVRQRDALRGELLHRTTAAQEAERQRIARELHDGTGQALTGLALGLRGIVNQLNGIETKLQSHLSNLEKMATNSLGELRHLINDLRPPQLDDMGLVAALRWMVERFNDRDALTVKFKVSGEPIKLSSDVETTLFRIAQECLTNVMKHAQATLVTVSLNYDDGPSLTVQDDGIGFKMESTFDPATLHTAWGLIGMQERAALCNATIDLCSEIGQGTTITIHLNPTVEKENKA